jgi:hypothetical protein
MKASTAVHATTELLATCAAVVLGAVIYGASWLATRIRQTWNGPYFGTDETPQPDNTDQDALDLAVERAKRNDRNSQTF